MTENIICIACPQGCHLNIEKLANQEFDITGNKCPRGKKYAVEEMTNPKRMVTYVVKSNSSKLPFIPIKTTEAIPIGLISELLSKLKKTEVSTPIKRGDILIKNFKNTDVDIVFTRTCSL
jgi:CxxC motif-containing protein